MLHLPPWSWSTSSSFSMSWMGCGMRWASLIMFWKYVRTFQFWHILTNILFKTCVSSGGHLDNNGLDAWWLWLHVGVWWSSVGSLHLHSPSLLSGQTPQPSESACPHSHCHTQESVWDSIIFIRVINLIKCIVLLIILLRSWRDDVKTHASLISDFFFVISCWLLHLQEI